MGVDFIMVTGEHISQLYQDYTNSLLAVNRTYQRKLVWTLEEKQGLIDTILKGYPVPLFLFVSRRETLDDGKHIVKREIIDGLQRLEAIISFINNKFPVEVDGVEQYFNLNSFPGPTLKVLNGELQQKEPVLNIDISNAFSQYYLAVTTIEADEIGVEDVFKRINATGRQLSPQELRQAGVVSKFSRMVQKIASRLRGDYTKQNIIPLDDMEQYSLSSKELTYGLDIRNIFWAKQGIMNFDGLRRSKDEEIIAHLCNCILSDYKAGISKKTLDRLYEETGDIYKKNESLLTEDYQILLTKQILTVFEDLGAALDSIGKTFKPLVTTDEKSRNMDLVFIVIFLAIYQLQSKGYVFLDYREFANCLVGIADEELSELIHMQDVKWDRGMRNRWIERISNRVKKCMNLSNVNPNADKELCELLGNAVAEEQMYDFKMGITNLADGSFNRDLIGKCVKTLVAMANTKPGNKGYIVFGIADDATAAKDFERHYNRREKNMTICL